jgi:uncharacterized protein YuzE
MSVTLAGITFDRVSYDREADVLYLHAGDPAVAADFDESPEGHHLRFDAEGRLVGLTLLHPRLLLERDGRITLTIPEHVEELEPDALSPALALAS